MRRRTILLFGPTTKGVVAPLLLVSLLFCHGFLGALHQVPDSPDHSHPAEKHSSQAPAEDLCDHPEICLGHSDYAAALISLLFGAILGLLLSNARIRDGFTAFRLPERFLPPLVLHLARGPTAPLVQVFRL